MTWFDVDKDGLAKILEQRGGKQFAVFELIQNTWDENSSIVEVELNPIDGRPKAKIRVQDDNPEGFIDITHAFTLFAESTKKGDPTKRGRFNLGEKLVLACCDSAVISTTKGKVIFEGNKRRHRNIFMDSGSVFEGVIKMTHAECDEVCQNVTRLIPPAHIETYFNGKKLETREPICTFEASLSTIISNEEGYFKRTKRKTVVKVYEPLDGEAPCIYEMGIPIVETEDKFHVEVCQKVPLNMDRDNVPPSYLKTLRTLVFNHTYDLIKKEEATDSWVREATSDERCNEDAFASAVKMRFGKKNVSYDPSDPEANKIAVSKGYIVVGGGSLSNGEWNKAREIGIIRPAGQVTPSPKPFSPDGNPIETIPPDKWTENMKRVAMLACRLATSRVGISSLVVYMVNLSRSKWPHGGAYGSGVLYINMGVLGKNFFEDFPSNMKRVVKFLIHEFGHEYSGDHLSSKYHDALCDVGAELVVEALENPSTFKV